MTTTVQHDADPWDEAHRPSPAPTGPWIGFMTWLNLLFAHWPKLELDTFNGSAWIGIVPFVMSNTRPRFSPVAMPDFPELNVRTYVTHRGKPGIYFFSLDAASRLLVRGGRTFASLPYYHATMRATVDEHGWTRYASRRTHANAPPAQWVARYRPNGTVTFARPGTIEHVLTERYCFYSVTPAGDALRCDVHHAPWPLQPAEGETETDTMLDQINLIRPATPPLLHFVHRLDVRIWWPAPAS